MIQQLEVFFEARRRSFDSLNDTRYPTCATELEQLRPTYAIADHFYF